MGLTVLQILQSQCWWCVRVFHTAPRQNPVVLLPGAWTPASERDFQSAQVKKSRYLKVIKNTKTLFYATYAKQLVHTTLKVNMLFFFFCNAILLTNSNTYTTYSTNITLTFTLTIYLLILLLILALHYTCTTLQYDTKKNHLKKYETTYNTILFFIIVIIIILTYVLTV